MILEEVVELALLRAARALAAAGTPTHACISEALRDVAYELRSLKDAPRGRPFGPGSSKSEILEDAELQAELGRLR